MKRDKNLEPLDDDEELDDEELDDDDHDDEELDELEDYPSSMGVRGFVAGVLFGAVVGAGVALLVAPDRGEAVRKRLGRGWRDIQDEARDHLDDWRGEARREVRKQRRRMTRRLNRSRRD